MEVGRAVRIKNLRIIAVALSIIVLVLFIVYRSSSHFSLPAAQHVSTTPETIKISQLLSAAIFLTEEAGKKVVAVRKSPNPSIDAVNKNTDAAKTADFVTLGDHLSQQVISTGLKSVWPSLRYRSEESEGSNLVPISVSNVPMINKEVSETLERYNTREKLDEEESVPLEEVGVWIDPLDATMEYTQGGDDPDLLKYVMVMMCITQRGKPVAAVLHQPFGMFRAVYFACFHFLVFFINSVSKGVSYWAWLGHGVSVSVLNKANIVHSTGDKIRMTVSRSHPGAALQLARRVFGGTKMAVEPVIAAGAGYKSLLVAKNEADLYFHTSRIKKWDVCPGTVLLETLGGKMTTRHGDNIDYHLDSNPEIQEGIVATLYHDSYDKYMEKLKI